MSILSAFRKQLRLRYLQRHLAAFGEGSFIPYDAIIMTPGNLHIGRNVSFGNQVYIGATEGGAIRIGDNCAIAAYTRLSTASHDYNHLPIRDVGINKPITIEDDVWIGLGAIILPGVTIGHGAVVGAGAVVSRDVDADTIVGGVPARLIRNIVRNDSD